MYKVSAVSRGLKTHEQVRMERKKKITAEKQWEVAES
jgi:hypothetical protein